MLKFVRGKTKGIWFFLFFVLLIYQSLAFFVIAPIESDGNGFANGSTIMLQSSWGNNWAAYSFFTQSGTYAIINLLCRVTGLTPLVLFSILSSICSILFVIFSSLLISKVISIEFPICGLCLLLFQETITGGYYANTTVIASVFILASLYLASINKGRLYEMIIMGVLFGIGAWIRFDAIIISPAIFFLLYKSNHSSVREAIKKSIIIFVSASIVLLAFLYGSGSSIPKVFQNAARHLESNPTGTQDLGIPLIGGADIKSHLSYFSAPLAFLIIIGLVEIIKAKKWILLGFVLSGIVPFYLVYSGTITTPKYLYYLLPFWGLLATLGLSRVVIYKPASSSGNILIIALAILSLQYLIGFRASFITKPYIKDPGTTLIQIVKVPLNKGSISSFSIVVGPGSLINTDDGNRLSSGLLFSPVIWINEKVDLDREVSTFSSYISSSGDNAINLWSDDYDTMQLTRYVVLNNKFLCAPDNTRNGLVVCKKNSQTLFLFSANNLNRNFDQIMSEIKNVSKQNLLVVTYYPWKQYLIQTNQPNWLQLTSFAYIYK